MFLNCTSPSVCGWYSKMHVTFFYHAMLCCHLFVCHKLVLYQNDLTVSVGFWHGSFLGPILNCVIRKFRYLQNKHLPLGTLSQTLDLENFATVSSCRSTKLVCGRAYGLHLRLSSRSLLDAQSSLHVGWL